MRVINFGSLNIDWVYQVPHFVASGETLASTALHRYPGGKGLNQSVALSRAGAEVLHAGCVGEDGRFLVEFLQENRVKTDLLSVRKDIPSGHAIIQVNFSGENSILLFAGANYAVTQEYIEKVFADVRPGDALLLQNEINCIPEIIIAAVERKMRIFFNPAPMREEVLRYPLEAIDTLIVNETEYEGIKAAKLPANLNVLKTLGSRGAIYNDSVMVPAHKVEKVVDTTAAGDTFVGYFMTEMLQGQNPEKAMQIATAASAYCIQRAGAAVSIPWRQDLLA